MIVRDLFFILFFEVKTITPIEAKHKYINKVFTLYVLIQMTHFLDLVNAQLLITSSASILSKSSFSMQSRPKEFNLFWPINDPIWFFTLVNAKNERLPEQLEIIRQRYSLQYKVRTQSSCIRPTGRRFYAVAFSFADIKNVSQFFAFCCNFFQWVLLNTAKDWNTAKDDKGPQIDVLNTAKYVKGL